MAQFVLKNAAVRINSVLLSTRIQEVNVNLSADEAETTAMGAGGHERIQGLRDDGFEFTAYSDFAASMIDQTVWPLFAGGSLFVVECWADGTVTSSSNPKYSGTVVLLEYTPISGAVGDVAMTPLVMPVTGTVTRATS